MAGGLAHELNSLLQPIVSMAQIALEDHQADVELTEELTVILDSANRGRNRPWHAALGPDAAQGTPACWACWLTW